MLIAFMIALVKSIMHGSSGSKKLCHRSLLITEPTNSSRSWRDVTFLYSIKFIVPSISTLWGSSGLWGLIPLLWPVSYSRSYGKQRFCWRLSCDTFQISHFILSTQSCCVLYMLRKPSSGYVYTGFFYIVASGYFNVIKACPLQCNWWDKYSSAGRRHKIPTYFETFESILTFFPRIPTFLLFSYPAYC